ncbi:MAG: hypothetical protein COV07_03570 [Candidatus Vogelbacteria bacterium CG10_big_fil_rev_8_21_14_0_10_45_14]|uniref:HTH deoR-type domain-containing protein n=1 Tax=Candidatus Vogelbacteria bacterium CG10_big_fil_rev_8_21_14_0_10_45_14 TaxID=1975042 RepID=A0A2H0RJC0_9BACT|nr:MAG: hypothetical protein COV07_03570 [Candidatus Vogelbacteria bacterium CG10_big_fil_rev_8_21_14_0_10_45_14]
MTEEVKTEGVVSEPVAEPIPTPEPVIETPPPEPIPEPQTIEPTPEIPTAQPVEPLNPEPISEPQPTPTPTPEPVVETPSVPEPVIEPEPTTSEPVSIPEPQPAPQPTPPAPEPQVIATVSLISRARELLVKARETIQFRKRKKLEKIMSLFLKKQTITNDDVEKLLHISDATATRYLEQLEKEGKIKQNGVTGAGVSYSRM